MRPNPVRARWQHGEAASNLWIDIGWPVTVEALGRLPYDSFTIDMQHSLIDRTTLVPLLQALSLGGGAPMVRVTQNDPAEIAYVLDAGAYGVICPTVETADDCVRFVQACDYPPRGSRSWGPVRGLMYGGADYFDAYATQILRIALIETKRGMDNLESIAATPDLDMIYLGPNDLGVSWGAKPSYTPNHPQVELAIPLVADAARRNNIVAGMHTASAETAKQAIAAGYRFVSLGYAAKIMFGAALTLLEATFPQARKK